MKIEVKPMNVLIKDTTRKEREEIIKNAISLSSVDSEPPTEAGMKLYNEYIEGNMELAAVKSAIIDMYVNKNA